MPEPNPGAANRAGDAGEIEACHAPLFHTDTELSYLDDSQAPGVEAYRERLAELFKDKTVDSIPHEKIIERLDEVSRTFRVLIIKTNMTVPYTSVFLQLDCAYWAPEAEKGLRAKMAAGCAMQDKLLLLLLKRRGSRRWNNSAGAHVANDVAVDFVVVNRDVHEAVRHLRG